MRRNAGRGSLWQDQGSVPMLAVRVLQDFEDCQTWMFLMCLDLGRLFAHIANGANGSEEVTRQVPRCVVRNSPMPTRVCFARATELSAVGTEMVRLALRHAMGRAPSGVTGPKRRARRPRSERFHGLEGGWRAPNVPIEMSCTIAFHAAACSATCGSSVHKTIQADVVDRRHRFAFLTKQSPATGAPVVMGSRGRKVRVVRLSRRTLASANGPSTSAA